MLLFLFLLASLPSCLCSVPSDAIINLPGWDQPLPSAQYSGYVNVQVEGQDCWTHYVFVESQNSPADDPLVLWQQGGPASSSFGYGYMNELGPFHLSDQSLQNRTSTGVPRPWFNSYSWDRLSSVLYLEWPAGTGYSYCADENGAETPCKWNDQTQAVGFYATLEKWFSLYPEYQPNPFYIMGESYAGILIPTLVDQIIQNQPNAINLQAVAVGNGCIGVPGSTPDNRGSCNGAYTQEDLVDFFYGHAMYDKGLYEDLNSACDWPETGPACEKLLLEMNEAIGQYYVYDIYSTCGANQATNSPPALSSQGQRADNGSGGDVLTFAEQLKSDVLTFAEQLKRAADPDLGIVYQQTPCGMDQATEDWMNQPEVREALHVRNASFMGHPWTGNSLAYMSYTTYTASSYDYYPEIVSRYRTLIYNGDVDACVPYNGNEDWTTGMAGEQGWHKTDGWRPWHFDNMVAGYVTGYETAPGVHNFTFLTIKDSGHMVPQYQPERSFAFYQRFLEGGKY